ncbi:response regulator [Novosphingobium sp.]|uniref:response regulator n=1 Tax=Novosphingobium sp. TaxID=1874826 RepID=UPI002FDEEC91
MDDIAPRREPSPDGAMPQAAATHPGLGPALVVEDEAVVALAMADALTEAGADDVSICHTTAAAMAEMQRLRPAILVLDVHLADRDDGWALAELAVAMSPRPPLIVFSTGTPGSIPPHIAGMGHVLAKPFPPEALIRLVRSRLRPAGLIERLRSALTR